MKKKHADQPIEGPTNQEPWNEQPITLQDIVLSNSWAVQAILNYLEELDPNARERIWYHYETMKQQQEAELVRRQQANHSPQPPDDVEWTEG